MKLYLGREWEPYKWILLFVDAEVLLLYLGWGRTSWVCHKSFIKPSVHISGAQKGHCAVSTVLYFSNLLANLMLTSQLFWGKALIVTIHIKSLCLGGWLNINFVNIHSQSASCCNLLRFQLVKLRLCQPLYWKHIF